MSNSRQRVLTEKGRQFQFGILRSEYRKNHQDWQRQLNVLLNSISDCNDTDKLRSERHELEIRFEVISDISNRIESLEINELEQTKYDNLQQDFIKADKEHNEALKLVNNRLLELKRAEESEVYSLASKNKSRKSGKSLRSITSHSSKSFADRKIEAATKLARIKAELNLSDKERQKKAAFHHSQEELRKFEIERNLEVARAEMNALHDFETIDLINPPSEICENERLDAYLEAQVNSVTNTESEGNEDCYPPRSSSRTNPFRNSLDIDQPGSIMGNIMDSPIEISSRIPDPIKPSKVHFSPLFTSFAQSTPVTRSVVAASPHTRQNSQPLFFPTTNPFSPLCNVDQHKSIRVQPPMQTTAEIANYPWHPQPPIVDQHKWSLPTPIIKSEPAPVGSSENLTVQNSDDSLVKLADLLAERRSRDSLPLPEPEVFRGEPLRYPTWLKSFETIVEGQTTKPSQRLYYLGKYTAGEAKEAISGYVNLDSSEAYNDAKAVLQNRYGNPFLVANAYRRKIADWPKIPPNDGISLRRYSDFLNQALTATQSINFLSSLNDPEENQRMARKLPNYLISSWGREVDRWLVPHHNDSTSAQSERSAYPPFSEFCKFLEREARIACNPVISLRAVKSEEHTSSERERRIRPKFIQPARNVGAFKTTAEVSNEQTPTERKKRLCAMCNNEHDLNTCQKFLALPLKERKDFVIKGNRCLGCLKRGHKNKDCKRKDVCKTCQGLHPTSLHDNAYAKAREKPIESAVPNRIEGIEENPRSEVSALIVPVVIHHTANQDEGILTYAVLDDQSDACFVKDDILTKLSVSGPEVNLKLSTVLEERTVTCRKVSGLVVRGLNENTGVSLPGSYSRDHIPARRSQIPRPEFAIEWPHLEGIASQLMPYDDNVDVGLLIGSNCARAIKPLEVIPGNSDDPYGLRTMLGWGIIGRVDLPYEGDEHPLTCAVTTESTLDERKCRFVFRTQTKELISPAHVREMMEQDFVENSNISDKALSQEERQFMEILRNNIRLNNNGHYEIPLPLRNANVNLPNNRVLAMRRLNSLRNRFATDSTYKERYEQFVSDMITKGHAEKVPQEDLQCDNGKVWYIPHHGVYHPQKPDKLRVVFDASCKFQGRSLNESLLPSPDLTNNLTGVLCRFRKEEVALTCDIEGMFHQVNVAPNHRNLLRFLWWEDGDPTKNITEYRMKVHLFGASSSPGCANFALKRAADDNETESSKQAANFIRNDFYVDDGLTSVPTIEEAVNLIETTKAMCQQGGFKLHKFTSNKRSVVESLPITERAKAVQEIDLKKDNLPMERTLGVQWSMEEDQFGFTVKEMDKPLTRRSILSTVSSIFDPLGLVSPFVLRGKRILQRLCKDGVGWDEKLPEELHSDWKRWTTELPLLSQLKIPRCYKPAGFGELLEVQLHNFSDASLTGYGQCSYLRMVNFNKEVHCCLVMAKSRVTPLKPVTVPRLELAAALVSAKMSAFLKRELRYTNIDEFFYTDSMVVLGYISNDARRFHTYVANRVQQIRELTSPSQWRHVDTANNPADDASRGLSPSDLMKSDRWWRGPEFLWHPTLDDSNQCPTEIRANDPEVKRSIVLATKTKEVLNLSARIEYFSDWFKARRAVANCIILQRRFKRPINDKELSKPLSSSSTSGVNVATLQMAEEEILKEVQHMNFSVEIAALKAHQPLRKDSAIAKLDPFVDQRGILRVGGRLAKADMEYNALHPVILPRKHHVTDLVIRFYHENTNHQGRPRTLAEIRSSGYWIVGGSLAVSRYISGCTTCIKMRGAPQQQKMAALPEDRVKEAPPFTYCAVDYFGPWLVKEGRKETKRYGVLFTCLSSRAIHIEVASSLTTDSFINAYRRFVGRRGPARQMRSDQGTNFVGAKNELNAAMAEFDSDKIKTELLHNNCDWVTVKMNVPHASHMGGVWERQIKTVRSVLQSLLLRHGSQLDDEALRTFMIEAEAIVNSRPLTVEDLTAHDQQVLSPSTLLTQKTSVVLPPPGRFENPDVYSRKRWRRVQYVANQFWIAWRRHYLQSLQHRQKWLQPKRNLREGDVVLLKDENLPRNQWRLGIVTATMPSDDGLVRKVRVQTGKEKKVYERPITKVVLLVKKEDVETVN